MNYMAVRGQLMLDEGVRYKPYADTGGRLTIGVGRNLTDVGISKDEMMLLLDNDINAAISALDATYPWWRGMSEVRQQVLVNMCFNMGFIGLCGFKLALAAMEAGNYEEAASQMQNSAWYGQVGARGIRLVSLMRNGG